ncbi:MAG: biotin--[Alphaproteobacteria bacterium]|nr:biotin--[acetyl-CoA-carboxylase] ligase [Alphaproteobacteria bacterium]
MKWQIHHFEQVLSTNELAKDFPPQSVIIADIQTGGRGRYGRVWESPMGNLYLSAVVRNMGQHTPFMAFVAGIAVAESLSDFGVRLKWPNDVLLDGKKLAGILLEQTDDGRLIIGIGVNVLTAPNKKMLYPTADLCGKISREKLAKRILDTLSVYMDLLLEKGFEPVRKKWLKYADGIGHAVKVNLPHQVVEGIFKEISPKGELILETRDKTVQKITAGDVFLIGK